MNFCYHYEEEEKQKQRTFHYTKIHTQNFWISNSTIICQNKPRDTLVRNSQCEILSANNNEPTVPREDVKDAKQTFSTNASIGPIWKSLSTTSKKSGYTTV